MAARRHIKPSSAVSDALGGSEPPALRIRFIRRADGTAALSCERRDGSIAWQRQASRHADFFALHDLTHYAVETTLGLQQAFYGLLAAGWDFADFGKLWPRGPLPTDGLVAEVLVGLCDQERASGLEWSAADVNESGKTYCATSGTGALWPLLTDAQLAAIRVAMRDLFARWHAVPVDGTLELEYPSSVLPCVPPART